MIHILLVDDQTLVRQGIHYLLEQEADLSVVGLASDGEEGIAETARLRPDVVLMDVRMPTLDGVAATRILAERFPEIGVIILTTFDDDEYVFEGLKAGARGYLLKDTDSDEMARAVRVVAAGQALIQPSIARKVVAEFNRLATAGATAAPPVVAHLTRRETEVLRLIAAGRTNREIASALALSARTIERHIEGLYRKIDAHNKADATAYAYRHGLAKPR